MITGHLEANEILCFLASYTSLICLFLNSKFSLTCNFRILRNSRSVTAGCSQDKVHELETGRVQGSRRLRYSYSHEGRHNRLL